jgi:hypothetical protein
MKRTSPPRRPADLSDSTHQQLSMYAIAAAAAGVGILALVQPSEAKIVYTPAKKTILDRVALNLDLNHDGVVDFYFYLYETIFRAARPPSPFGSASLRVSPKHAGNRVLDGATYHQRITASALPAGAHIGPKRKFSPGKHLMAATHYGCSTTCNGNSNGPWKDAKDRYLGLKFKIGGKVHYGWARLTVHAHWGDSIQARLSGYAYETIPGKAIIAGATKGPDNAEPTTALSSHPPEAATLGALALGVPGLSIWRRKEPAAVALAAN